MRYIEGEVVVVRETIWALVSENTVTVFPAILYYLHALKQKNNNSHVLFTNIFKHLTTNLSFQWDLVEMFKRHQHLFFVVHMKLDSQFFDDIMAAWS